jgi:transporter family protein
MPAWLIFSLLTLLLWGGWGVLSKILGATLSPVQIQVLSTLGVLPVVLVLAMARDLRRGTRPRRGAALAFASGVLVGLGNLAYYEALAKGGKASSVAPLTALYPAVTIVLAIVFMRERISISQLTGIGLALVAIALFNTGAEAWVLTTWLGFALLPLALWGSAAFLQKLAADSASSSLTTLAFLAAFVPLALALLPFETASWAIASHDAVRVLVHGVLFAAGNLTLIAAYGAGGKASVVTPLSGLYGLVTALLAVVFLGEQLAQREWLGVVVSLVAVVAIAIERPHPRHPPMTP